MWTVEKLRVIELLLITLLTHVTCRMWGFHSNENVDDGLVFWVVAACDILVVFRVLEEHNTTECNNSEDQRLCETQ
jgi:hypothetical protein